MREHLLVPEGTAGSGQGQNPKDRPKDTQENDNIHFSLLRTSAWPRSFGDTAVALQCRALAAVVDFGPFAM